MITLTNYTILTFYYLLVWAACAAPLSEKIMIELLFEEKRNHVFKLRLTICLSAQASTPWTKPQ